jgi:hypothetical protein
LSLAVLFTSANGAIGLAAERDDITGAVIALRARNTTSQPCRVTLTRPVGDQVDLRVAPDTPSARRVLVTPLLWDVLADAWQAGVAITVAHPVA